MEQLGENARQGQASRHEIAEAARRHYERLATAACDWMSAIPAAIDVWEHQPDSPDAAADPATPSAPDADFDTWHATRVGHDWHGHSCAVTCGEAWREAKRQHTAALAERDALRTALLGLMDNEPCRLDHHGYCQTHNVSKPCVMAEARAALAAAPQPPQEPAR